MKTWNSGTSAWDAAAPDSSPADLVSQLVVSTDGHRLYFGEATPSTPTPNTDDYWIRPSEIGAPAAGNVTFSPTGLAVITGAATNVQTALAEVDAAVAALTTRVAAVERAAALYLSANYR